MNKILIIFECDAHRSYDSHVIKYMSTNKTCANKTFVRLKKEWDSQDSEGFTLNFAEYEPNSNASCGSNIFSELTIIKTV